jgi:hypothetical protein
MEPERLAVLRHSLKRLAYSQRGGDTLRELKRFMENVHLSMHTFDERTLLLYVVSCSLDYPRSDILPLLREAIVFAEEA